MYMVLMYSFLNFISLIVLVFSVLIGVAFLTLMERKVLGYIQIRKGPNKVGFKGLVQPFSDAIKLLTNEMFLILKANHVFFFFSPILGMMISLISWSLMPFVFNLYSFNLSILFLFCCLGFNSYSAMLAGWSSNSNYAMLGCLRSIAQSVSYEVSFMLIIFILIVMVESFSLKQFLIFQNLFKFLFILFPVFLMFYISVLAELNRSPFDLLESESELVSGFNVEYSSSGFTLIFLAEYSSILFMSMIMVLMFLGVDFYSFSFFLLVIMFSFSIIWIRGVMPRMRYDELMYMCWKKFLPLSLMILLNVVLVKYLFLILLQN